MIDDNYSDDEGFVSDFKLEDSIPNTGPSGLASPVAQN